MSDQHDDYDDDFDQDDCWQCGGEGYTWDCIDGFCVNAEDGCDMCTRRCDICRPRTPKQQADTAALQQVLGDALAKREDNDG